jgi:hypothetical protein
MVDALTNDDYDLQDKPSNVFSATEIIDAPKNRVLTRRHSNEITVDVSDNFHMLDGSAVHYAIEMSNKKEKNRLAEERIFIEVGAPDTDWKAFTMTEGNKVIQDEKWYDKAKTYVAVKFDSYDPAAAVIEDYKRTSAWETVRGLKASRVEQLNIGALALRILRFNVETVRAVLILKDWTNKDRRSAETRSQSFGKECDYPPIPYKEYEFKAWSVEEMKKFVYFRVNLHVNCMSAPDDQIPECDLESRWYRGEQYAVVKEGLKTAKRVFKVEMYDKPEDAYQDATACLSEFRAEKPKEAEKFSIEVRPGIDQRCNGEKAYCACREFCHYWIANYKDKNVTDDSGY